MTLHAAKWAIAGLALTVSLFSQAPTNSLVAHFKLDGSLRDETGTVTSGVNGGATFVSDRFGQSSGAAYFDGRSYINFGNVTILNGATEATWSFWMRTSQRAPQSGYISVLRKDRAWLPLQGAQDIPPGTWRSPMYFEGKPEWSGPNYGQLPQISDGNWHMFTVVFGAGSLRTFIDGNLIQAISTYGTVPSGALQTSTNPFSLGASFDSGSPADCYVGNLDDIRIYRRALTPTEVAQLYQAESTTTTSQTTSTPDLTTGLVGRYPLDGDGRDLSSSGNNLILNSVQPAQDRNGNSNGALYLNGTTSWMVTGSDLVIAADQPRTLAIWIKSDDFAFYSGAPVLIGFGDKSGTGTLFDLCLDRRPGSGGWQSTGTASVRVHCSSVEAITTDYPIPPNQWIHIVASTSGSIGTTRIYVNGVRQSVSTSAQTALYTARNKMRVSTGSVSSGPVNDAYIFWNQGFKGSLDDIRIYNRELTEAEITALSKDGSTGSATPQITNQPSGASVIAGQSPVLSVSANGSAPLAYQWLKNGVTITGANATTYTVANATAADAGIYTVTVSNPYGSVTSSPATVTVTTPQPQAPAFTLQPASITATAGSSRSFTVAVSGYPIPTLQWLKNGVRLTGQTRETLTLGSVSAADAGTYTCEATNASGTTVSQAAILSVGQAPFVVKALPITTVEAKIGDPLRIDLPPLGGTEPLSYRWTRDSTVIALSGPALQIGALTSAGAGLYSCSVSNAYGSVQIDRLRVTLVEAPRITSQPQPATIAANGSATFRVTASGTPAPTYQWYRNEVPLSGQTATQITVSGSPATQTVGGYYCVVTNRAGSVRSATAGLTVSAGTTTAPSITRTVQQQEIGRSVMLADSDTVFVPGLGQVFASYSTFSESGSGTDITTSGTLSYNNELRPRAGSARDYEANFAHRTPLGVIDYGNFVVSLPTGDTDGDGINDAFDYRLSGNLTAQGSGYDYTNITAISAGRYHTMFISTDGKLWAVGGNAFGQLGDGTKTDRSTPIQLANGVASVSAGQYHTMFVKSDGTLWAMGLNSHGQIGDGTTTTYTTLIQDPRSIQKPVFKDGTNNDRSTPVQVASGVVSVSAGEYHTIFVKTDGTLWGAGRNDAGQLGDGTTTDRNKPVLVVGGVAKVSAGGGYTMFVKTDGTLWGAGRNDAGQLGVGNTGNRSTPVQVTSGVSSVSAGYFHTMFIKVGGALWAMGDNTGSQLGDGATSTRYTPFQVASSVSSVSAGDLHTVYIKTDGRLWSVGDNNFGQLGDSTTFKRSLPVQLTGQSTPVSIELRFTRAAGEVKGRYTIKNTMPTGNASEYSGDFYVSGPNGIRVGSTTYVRGASSVMNVSLAPDPALANNNGTPYSGSFAFTVVDRDTIAYNAFELTSSTGVKYSVRAGTLKRNGRVYGGTLSYVDGRTSTAFADYVSSYFTITDPNDADGDGIPDLTDDLPAPPALASFSGTAQTLPTGARLEFTATAQGTGIFVWKKDGVVLRTSASASADTFAIPAVARTDTGSYWVELTNGGGTSASAVVPIVVSANEALPVITGQPVAAQLSTGSNLILTVDALAGSSPRYQWRKDGVDIPGATGSSYGKVSLNTTEAGHYSVLVTNDAGATVSQLASVSYSTGNEAIPLLSNLSVRTQLQPNVPLIVGAVVSGTGKPLLMRAAGPALDKFGLQGVRESEIKLYDPNQNVIAARQGWDASLDTIFPLVGAFPFTAGSKDSAVVRSMGGAFTLHTLAPSAGAALVELYDATGGSGQRLVNLSVRNRVGADSDILIVGLAVGGVGRINLLLRAVGPTLGSFGVAGTLEDPKITIYGPSGAALAANDNWSADLNPVFARVGAFGLAAGSRDAALLFSADAGSVYTVHVAGVNNTTGEALVEVYEVP